MPGFMHKSSGSAGRVVIGRADLSQQHRDTARSRLVAMLLREISATDHDAAS